ncbi:hypothetical protein ACQ4PT_035046 [Festuca glaucescens]
MDAKVVAVAIVLLILTLEEDDFGVSAYAVKWSPPASQEDDFGVSAYAVKWSPPASQEDDFGVSAYAMKWSPPASQDDDFRVSPYAVKWSPPASQEDDFGVSAYEAYWKISPASQEKSSAYAVHWDEDSAPSKEKGFVASSYAVHWDEDSAPSRSPVPEAHTRHQHIKVQTGMLFLKKSLHVGTVLPEGTMFARAGLPKPDNSVSTPLEPKYLATILSHFKIPHNSMKAKQVSDTLRSCGKLSDKEEPQMCFSSRGEMARFATKELGVRRAQASITRIHGHETPDSRYVVARITPVSTNMVPCHPMDFPYEVYYCHRPKEVQSFRVQLKEQENGIPLVTTTAMCHMNTSDWDKQYFELLGGERGEPICHYMPQNYIMFY